MAISFENALGVHPDALHFRVQRSKVLASNLANVDTPGYLARDLAFETVMKNTSSRVDTPPPEMDVSAKYRVPYQNSKTGNTVELGVEQAKFAQNNMDFQTSLTFMNMKFSGLAKAIEGR
ncbi:flagellar basal body rod protein FlgB [Photobacterium galatheae]|uniref:Flagellar basal body rod protein FlgB n=1 Tax=Photobacterium galatheae TaxID=1654360 RepID=A0A066RXX8_9GAMM|nr:flagellar basal body rod protein FlgB [Photobacterium galatheae]KDM92223.1 flagellar basal body rod protein FlgB [Photobacterium galatheae]MCM0150597.1 flagellar basal body rod protein FlgB [Photobacterium galatheae]